MHVPLAFWSATSNCFTKRQYVGKYRQHDINFTYPTHPTTISKKRVSISTPVGRTLGKRNTVLIDYRPFDRYLSMKTIENDLRKAHALDQCHFRRFQKMIMRVLLNPNPDIQRYLISFKRSHYNGKHVFGVQIRLGGCLANRQEKMSLMSQSEFKSIPKRIRQHIRKLTNPVVYLSTDSDYAEKYIRSALPEITILTSSALFKRSHSTGITTLSNVESALVDLFLLSDSDILMYQDRSGFGRIAALMTRAHKTIPMKVTHQLIKSSCPSAIV